MASSPPLLILGNLPCQLHPDIPVLKITLNKELDFIPEFMTSSQVVSSLWLALRCLNAPLCFTCSSGHAACSYMTSLEAMRQ